jgi:PAS domain S-box-containing protein
MTLPTMLDRLARRLGGVRILALPVARVLAVLVGLLWIAVVPAADPHWPATALAVLLFGIWSAAIIALLWMRPGPVLRLNLPVFAVDLAFGLVLVRVAGGAASAMFLALLLITSFQSYYYGMRRGVVAGLVAAVGYLMVLGPIAGGLDWANVVIRIAMLLGAAVGIGLLADLETAERLKVAALTDDARQRERFIRSVVESLRDGVVALDTDGRVLAWNAAMESHYGVAASEVLGQNLFELFPALQREAWAAGLRQLLRGEIEQFTFEGVEHEFLRRGPVVQNLKGSLLRAHGRPVGAVFLVEDITERVAFERSARRAEKLAALGTMAAGLAHELNNPIGVISSRAELMLLEAEARALGGDVREDLEVIHRHAQRVARITEGLLSFARRSSGEPERVDLNAVVEATLLLVDKTIAARGITLTAKTAPGLPPVWGDPNRLQQVLVNLLTNACDALAQGGAIQVETAPVEHPARGVRLTVRDTGPGIPPDVVGRIFDPFFTTKASGTGLGLAISYGIVREHRGSMDVESTPGRGTAFVLTFPEGGGAPAEASAGRGPA